MLITNPLIILIIDFKERKLWLYFSVFLLVYVFIEKTYVKLKMVFQHISKLLSHQKYMYSIARYIFNSQSLFGDVVKHSLSCLKDILLLMLKFSADCFACISFQTCYICEERGRESKTAHGACMNCNKTGCRHAFHVTWWASLFMLSTLFLW